MIYTYRHLNFGTLKLAAMGIVPKSQPDQCMVVVCVCVCAGMSVQKITVLGVKKECVWCEFVCSMCVHRFMCQYRKSLLWVLKRSVCGVTVCSMRVCVCVCVWLGWGCMWHVCVSGNDILVFSYKYSYCLADTAIV